MDMEKSRFTLLLTNLLNDLETLCHLLVDRIGSGATLNAYLVAAEAQHIVDDYLHRYAYSSAGLHPGSSASSQTVGGACTPLVYGLHGACASLTATTSCAYCANSTVCRFGG